MEEVGEQQSLHQSPRPHELTAQMNQVAHCGAASASLGTLMPPLAD